MNDTYHELLIARKQNLQTTIIRAVLIALCIAFLLTIPITGLLGIVFASIIGLVSHFFIFPKLDVEFEYALLNKELTIDVIYKKSKRKNLLHIDLGQAEVIAPCNSSHLGSLQGLKTYNYTSLEEGKTFYTILLPLNGTRCAILIEPDEIMINQISTYLPRTFFQN